MRGTPQRSVPPRSRIPSRRRAASRGPRRQTSPGFSLTELMVVAAVVATLAVMITPVFRTTRDAERLRGAARELIQVLRLASSQAVLSGSTCRVRLDPSRGRYQLEARSAGDFSAAGFRPLGQVPGGTGSIDPAVRISLRRPGEDTPRASRSPRRRATLPAALDAVPFHADGTSEACEILLVDPGGASLVLRVNPTTARVRILDERDARRPRERPRPRRRR